MLNDVDSTSFEMAKQQTVEMMSSQDEKDESMNFINDNVLSATGLNVHLHLFNYQNTGLCRDEIFNV
jgi:hypothetical protein